MRVTGPAERGFPSAVSSQPSMERHAPLARAHLPFVGGGRNLGGRRSVGAGAVDLTHARLRWSAALRTPRLPNSVGVADKWQMHRRHSVHRSGLAKRREKPNVVPP